LKFQFYRKHYRENNIKQLVYTVWVDLKAVITEKTIKQE